jgi:hypothetical protein
MEGADKDECIATKQLKPLCGDWLAAKPDTAYNDLEADG